MLRPAGAGEALPVRAGVGRGHHRDGRHPGDGPGGFDEEKRPEERALFRRGGGEEGRVFGHVCAVRPAGLKFDLLDAGRVRPRRKKAGDDLPESIGIVHRLMFGCDLFRLKIGAIFDVRVMVLMDMLDDLASERQDGFFVRHLILVDVDW